MYPQNDETQSDRVAQATGMVSVQAACSVDEALAMIEERARTIDLTAEEVAESVVERQFRFSIRSSESPQQPCPGRDSNPHAVLDGQRV
jgi:hypothetical protein